MSYRDPFTHSSCMLDRLIDVGVGDPSALDFSPAYVSGTGSRRHAKENSNGGAVVNASLGS